MDNDAQEPPRKKKKSNKSKKSKVSNILLFYKYTNKACSS